MKTRGGMGMGRDWGNGWGLGWMAGLLIAGLFAAVPLPGNIWTHLIDRGDGWKQSSWYGSFHPVEAQPGWAYHRLHGWVWINGPSENNLWVWDMDLGWVWTAEAHHPFFYHLDARDWLYYLPASKVPRWYFSMGLHEWTPVGGGVVAAGLTTPASATGMASLALPVFVSLGDGTHVEMPPLNEAVAITIGRESNDWQFVQSGLTTSGSARTLEIAVTPGLDPDLVTPVIAFPLAEAGLLNENTLNVLRLETVDNGDGTTREERILLPVTMRDGLLVTRDYMMPETVKRKLTEIRPSGAIRPMGAISVTLDSESVKPKVRYLVCSFNGSLNYRRLGQLVRMVPDPTSPHWRVPFDRATPAQQRMEDGKLPHNIVVLVHGHNEEEKGGIYQASAEWPWHFGYKRDVWTQYFRYLQTEYFTPQATVDLYMSLERTTHFYEFVYPSYRGVFNDLDLQLSARLREEFSPLLEAGIPFNLVMVAHSMGGLVARAAIQQFPGELDDRFKELITWGTPHMGSPLVTLRYVLAADLPYDFGADDPLMLAGLERISGGGGWGGVASPVLKSVIRQLIAHVQMDAPGTRDLRYVRRPQQEPSYRLGLERLFSLSAAQRVPIEEQKYNLQSGSAIYNFNLQIMNQSDRHAGSNRYFPIIGRTDHRVGIERSDTFPWFRVTNLDRETAQGATIMPLLVADPDEETWLPTRSASVGTAGESDGAVNIPSMAAMGVSNYVGTAYAWDHEDYYGAPDATGTLRSPTLGRNMAIFTIARTKGGSSSVIHDRYGLMPVPRMGYRLGNSLNVETVDGLVTSDAGYARDIDLVLNLRFNALDELADAPFSIFDGFSLKLVDDGVSPDTQEAVVIPLADPIVAPHSLPSIHRTGGTFVPTSEYAPGNLNLLAATIPLGRHSMEGKSLHVCLRAADGTDFHITPPLKIRNHSPEGTWTFDLLLQNNAPGNGAITRWFYGLEINLDADGHGEFDFEIGGLFEPETMPGDLLGEYDGTHWHFEGSASLLNNRFRIDLVITMTHGYLFRRRIWNTDAEEFDRRTTIRHKDASFALALSGMVENWLQPQQFRFVPDSVSKESFFEVHYRSKTDTEGEVDENIDEQFDGTDVTFILDLTQP